MEKADKRILVVDDEQDLCEILSFNIQIEGYHVDTANSAEEALEMDIASYDLLLLDVDGIITDDPANTKEVISNANDSIIEDWMKRLIYKY